MCVYVCLDRPLKFSTCTLDLHFELPSEVCCVCFVVKDHHHPMLQCVVERVGCPSECVESVTPEGSHSFASVSLLE